MERDSLINEIISFCFDYELPIDKNELKAQIADKLKEAHFIESLINAIVIKAKNSQTINKDKVKRMLLELEKIRLELEY